MFINNALYTEMDRPAANLHNAHSITNIIWHVIANYIIIILNNIFMHLANVQINLCQHKLYKKVCYTYV